MTTTAQIEDALLAALRTIRAMWPVLHGSAGAGSIAAKPPAKVLYSHDIDSEQTDDLPRVDVVIDLKAEATSVLNSWARVVVEEQDLTHALPLGHDVPGLCELIERWARWFSGHEAAQDMLEEVSALARKMTWTAFPSRPDAVTIGACPNCSATVRSKPGASVIRCRECGCVGEVQEWVDTLEGALLELVTLPSLVEILYRRMHLRVTERTLRNWRRDGLIAPTLRPDFHTPVPRPPLVYGIGPVLVWDLYDPITVMRQISVMHRPCAMCGTPWQGVDSVCFSCQPLVDHRPQRVGPVLASRPGKAQPVPVTIWPKREEEKQVCRMSDLPIEWCAHCIAQAGTG